MKKIMFNDKYGLTQAVLEGRKTMTRRIIPLCERDLRFLYRSQTKANGCSLLALVSMETFPAYNVGDCLAVAQSYSNLREVLAKRDFKRTDALYDKFYRAMQMGETHDGMPGWGNKMFVRADLMPHSIRITDIKCERLQDISDKDCLKEGIEEYFPYIDRNPDDKVKSYRFRDKKSEYGYYQLSPIRDCFAVLIDRICGKGTWNRNPWVFAYDFELIE